MGSALISKETILQECRKIVSEKGIKYLNTRLIAKECNIALGSLYNYFPSKGVLIIETVESVWRDIFHNLYNFKPSNDFCHYLQELFDSLIAGTQAYPNFFTTHSLSFASSGKVKAKESMDHYFKHIKAGLLKSLKQDTNVKKNAFSKDFTETDFIDFILSNILTLIIQKSENCNALIEVVRRTLY